MSSTGRGGATRLPNDDYQTPPPPIRALLAHVKPFGRFLEPCRGSGNILEAVRPYVTLASAFELSEGSDFLGPMVLERRYDWIITNPPFSLACEFIERSLILAEHVAMLLRLNFLESEERRAWWQPRLPTALYALSQRPGFLDRHGRRVLNKHGKPGVDSCGYAWFVWSALYQGIHVIGDPTR